MGGVAILDCGAQYAKVIDRRIRELGVHSDILPVTTPVAGLSSYEAFIISGGPNSVYAEKAPQCDPQLFTLGKPILGICYGMQLVAQGFTGEVGQKKTKEYGETDIHIDPTSQLFIGLEETQQVLMSHGDSVTQLPEGFVSCAMSGTIIAAIAHEGKRIYGVQFHPEVDLTPNGKEILRNFLFRIAKLEKTHTLEAGIDNAIRDIRTTVGKEKVAVLVSGGVDSTVTAALLLRALQNDQIYAIHIDHGLMRKEESRSVMKALQHLGLKHFDMVAAHELFLNSTTTIDGKESLPLCKTVDPEEKRKIIGDTFMRLVDEELAKIEGTVFIAQGTLRPDLIESASEMVTDVADTIKTHHNDSTIVREKRKQGMIIETNKDWHKDEVRQIARTLDLPATITERQPFPGPGLAVRILCANEPYIERFDSISKRVGKLAKIHGLKGGILPIKSVGVQGDGRSYAHVAILSGNASWDVLKQTSSEIPKQVHDVNRVCYVLKGSFSATKKIIPTLLTSDTISLLREADAIAALSIKKHHVNVAQLPVVLLPVGPEGKRTIVLRPFITNDFMTGRAATIGGEIPQICIDEIAEAVMKLDGIGMVLYDLTSKPPATTEWE